MHRQSLEVVIAHCINVEEKEHIFSTKKKIVTYRRNNRPLHNGMLTAPDQKLIEVNVGGREFITKVDQLKRFPRYVVILDIKFFKWIFTDLDWAGL